jgi:hypothetical protein
MTPLEPPKPLVPLAFEELLLGLLLIAGGLWLGAWGNALGWVSSLGAALLMLVKLRNVSTRLDEAGVSQLTWRGRVRLPWNDVSAVQRRPLSWTLAGGGRRVVVSVEEFADSAAARTYIEAHLPATLRAP